jgi:hypothetical protein
MTTGACSRRRHQPRGEHLGRRPRGVGLDRQSRRSPFGAIGRGPHDRREERVRAVGPALELGVRLGRDEEGVRRARQLDELDEPLVGRGARAHEPRLLEPLAVLVVDLVPVTVPFVHDVLAVRSVHDRAGRELRRVRAEAHRAAEVDDVALLVHEVDDRVG